MASEHISSGPVPHKDNSNQASLSNTNISDLESLFESFFDEYFGTKKSNISISNSDAVVNQEESISITETPMAYSTKEFDTTPITATPQIPIVQNSSDEPSTDSSLETPVAQHSPELEEVSTAVNLSIQNSKVHLSLETLEQNSSNTYIDPSNDQTSYQPLPLEHKWTRAHSVHQIIRGPTTCVRTRRASANECLFTTFLSKIEPTKVTKALQDPE